jgi:hypothetical protein
MAWRNTFLREHAEESGLGFIDLDEGAKAAAREIMAAGGDVEVVLHRGLGDLLDRELADADPSRRPFIDWSERHHDGRRTFRRHFSPRRDGMLDHHRLGKTSLMPGVGLMEMMAEAHALATGENQGALVFRKLEFLDALKFYRDEGREVEVRLAAQAGAAPAKPFAMEVWSPFRSPQGDVAENRLYARAHVSREKVALPKESPAAWSLGKETQRLPFVRAIAGSGSSRQGINLGPLLTESSRAGHDVSANQVLVNENGLVTRIQMPKAQLSEPRYPFAGLHINPAFLDCMHQAAAIFSIFATGSIHLPVGAEEFVIWDAPNRDAHYDVIALMLDRSAERLWFDVALLRDGKDVCCIARRVVLRRTGQ